MLIAMVTLSERVDSTRLNSLCFPSHIFSLAGYPIASTCSPASLETVRENGRLVFLAMAKSKAHEEDGSSENGLDTGEFDKPELLFSSIEDGDENHLPFLSKQKSKLLQLRDNLLDSMTGDSRDTLRSRAEGSEASAFGMHQADAGSDAYDRDFALSLLSQAGCSLRNRRGAQTHRRRNLRRMRNIRETNSRRLARGDPIRKIYSRMPDPD